MVQDMVKEEQDRIIEIARAFQYEIDVWRPVYDEIEKGYKFLAGEQYDEAEIQWYKSQRRPTNVFNMIFPHVNVIMGDFLENDKKPKVYPMGAGSREIAALLEDILDSLNFDPSNDFAGAMVETLLAALVKVGWIYPHYANDSDNIDGRIIHKNVDEFEIMFDSRAKDYFLDDAVYLMRSRWLRREDIEHIWPHKRRELATILRDRNENGYWDSVPEDVHAMCHYKEFIHEIDGRYRVIEYHKMTYERTEVAYNPMTRDMVIWDVEGEKADRFLKSNPDYRITEMEDKIKYITYVIPGLNFHLEHKRADLQDKTFDYIPLFAYKYAKKTIDSFGIFKNSMGPQRELNDWHNRTADILNKSANPGQIWRPGYVRNPRDVENYISMTGKDIQVKDDAPDLDQVWRRIDPPSFPQGTDVMQREALDLLPKILGITPNQMGFSETRQEPAELFARRVRQATKALATVLRNINRTKKRRDDKTLSLIQRYYNTQRIFPIISKDTNDIREVMINVQLGDRILNDITVGRYQVVIDDIEQNPTARMARFELKTQLVQFIANLYGPAAIDPEWWLKEADLGDVSTLIERINAAMNQIAESTQEAEGFAATQQLMDIAQKRTDMMNIDNNNNGNNHSIMSRTPIR